ncbi:MAG: Fic family protein [Propionibacteriaceae bacterium]|jgi:fido (protein-threonine AMPylation protein)|nr:Fic family protein [Propionibacteriaceae bacterium]
MTYEPFPAFADWSVDFDPSVVEGYASRLRRIKAAATPEARRQALTVATRYAAVDTGAIEGLYTTDRGFTETIARRSEFWRQALDQKGERVKRSIEDALAGYDYVLDAVTGSTPISSKWIRELHAVITKHQSTYTVYVPGVGQLREDRRPLPHGEYKQFPNNPTSASTGRLHHYAPPEDTASELTRLMDELGSDRFQVAHPVVQSAYAHYAFSCVHPFADGNGRVARALASVYLYRAPGVPLVIFADQRGLYIDALEAADAGRPSAFVRFVEARVIDVIGLLEQSMAVQPSQAVSASDLNALAPSLPSEEIVLLSKLVLSLCSDSLREALGRANLDPSFHARVLAVSYGPIDLDTSFSWSFPIPSGYAPVNSHSWVAIYARTGPAQETRPLLSHIIAMERRTPSPRLLVVADDGTAPLEVLERDLNPVQTTAFSLKLKAWADGAVQRFMERLRGALV